jgi:hypothetical protein
MTHLAQIATLFSNPQRSSSPGFLNRIHRHFARVEAAMASQSRLSSMGPETECDTGLSAEDLTGVASHDPALPFFMQAGFGRHDR